MTLRTTLRRLGDALLDQIETLSTPPPPAEPTWAQLRNTQSTAAAKHISARSMRELDDALARMEQLRTRTTLPRSA